MSTEAHKAFRRAAERQAAHAAAMRAAADEIARTRPDPVEDATPAPTPAGSGSGPVPGGG